MELISLAKLHWFPSNIKFERFYMDDIENLISMFEMNSTN